MHCPVTALLHTPCSAVDRTVTTDASVGLLAKFMGIEHEAQTLMEQVGPRSDSRAMEDIVEKVGQDVARGGKSCEHTHVAARVR